MNITEVYEIIEQTAFTLGKDNYLKDKIGGPKGYIYINDHGIKFIIDWYDKPGKYDQKLMQMSTMLSWIEYGADKDNLKAVFMRSVEHIKYQIIKHYRKQEL